MNFFKRAFASITRRKGKSLILFAIVFVLGNVIAGAISIRQATDSVEKNIKSQLGARATIQQNYELTDDPDFVYTDFKMYTVDEIKQIGASPYVKYFDYSASFYPNEQKKVTSVEMESDEMMGGSSYPVTLKGVNDSEFIDIKDKKVEITDGRTLSADEIKNGDGAVVVSEKLAEANNWHVGDRIIYDVNMPDYDPDTGQAKETYLFQKDYAMTVVGIFKPLSTTAKSSDKKETQDQKWNREYQELSQLNQMYTSNKVISEMNKEQNEVYNKKYAEEAGEDYVSGEDYEYYTPVYVLKSSEDTDAFKQDASAILGKYWLIVASTDQYDAISGSIKGMSKISTYVLYIAVGASLLIVTLVILLFLRDRKHELGIYLSLGEKRGKVIGQIVIEVFVISFVAITLSVFSGNFLAKGVSGSLMNSEMLGGSSNNNDNYYYYGDITNTTLTDEDVKDAYEVKLTASYILIFYVVGIGTILLSTIVPLIYILRLNPKKIMM